MLRSEIPISSSVFHIRSFFSLIAKHGFHFAFCTVIISLAIPTECTVHHIIVDIYRLILSLRTRNPYGKNDISVYCKGIHIFIGKQIDIDTSKFINELWKLKNAASENNDEIAINALHEIVPTFTTPEKFNSSILKTSESNDTDFQPQKKEDK